MSAKDIYSRHLIATDTFARIIGFSSGREVKAKLDAEMPLLGTDNHAPKYIKEDQRVMQRGNPREHLTVVNTHKYRDEIKVRVFIKSIFYHEPSSAILGTIYHGHDVDLRGIHNLLPQNIIRRNQNNNLIVTSDSPLQYYKLTEYEQEICFLLLLSWYYRQIAKFMHHSHPEKASITTNAIVKKKTIYAISLV